MYTAVQYTRQGHHHHHHLQHLQHLLGHPLIPAGKPDLVIECLTSLPSVEELEFVGRTFCTVLCTRYRFLMQTVQSDRERELYLPIQEEQRRHTVYSAQYICHLKWQLKM